MDKKAANKTLDDSFHRALRQVSSGIDSLNVGQMATEARVESLEGKVDAMINLFSTFVKAVLPGLEEEKKEEDDDPNIIK